MASTSAAVAHFDESGTLLFIERFRSYFPTADSYSELLKTPNVSFKSIKKTDKEETLKLATEFINSIFDLKNLWNDDPSYQKAAPISGDIKRLEVGKDDPELKEKVTQSLLLSYNVLYQLSQKFLDPNIKKRISECSLDGRILFILRNLEKNFKEFSERDTIFFNKDSNSLLFYLSRKPIS